MPSPASPDRHDYAPAARRLITSALLVGALATFAFWAWHQPFMSQARTMWELGRMPPPTRLPVPVDGVGLAQIADTWGAARGSDRRHEGVDIFAEKGTPVLSTTPGVVSAVRESGLGGKQVWVIGPAMERHYYAHLDDWAPGLVRGNVVRAGATLGYVGNSGNARGTPPHLHYGIYTDGGAEDPLPRMRAAQRPPVPVETGDPPANSSFTDPG